MSNKKENSARGDEPAPATTPTPKPPTSPRAAWLRRIRWPSVLAASAPVIVAAVVTAAFLTRPDLPPQQGGDPPTKPDRPRPHHVGSTACATCHTVKYAEWRESQHGRAMSKVDEATVLGDFANAELRYAGTTSRFFKRDGRFFVNTDGPDGKLGDFEVRYTFGVEPLQQYLVELPGGRLQALSIAWDSRPRKAGGQRWFHLYPKEQIRSDDELHWTRPSQNWNDGCADCHSTGVRKNFDAAKGTYATHFEEISVGCEGCHGPGSDHVAWAGRAREGHASSDSSLGLAVRYAERRGVKWTVSRTSGNATRSAPRESEREIEACAQCHSRRSQLADGYQPGAKFYDYYRPALLTAGLYHADGTQRDEVYTWGSFLQSRMYAKGVTCSDCHEPHTGKTRAAGNALCSTCHLPAKYDAQSHHRHKRGSAAATCTSCHMPTTNYMVVDPRHDHSLRVPRPDLSVALGTPNACTGCHTRRNAKWAAERVRKWYGHQPRGYQRFGEAFAAADRGRANAQRLLAAIARDDDAPMIARASALSRLSPFSSQQAFAALGAGLASAHPVERLAALDAVASLPPAQRAQLAAPLLSDSTRAVRTAAARLLAPESASLDAAQRAAFDRAAKEFVELQRQNADRADARATLGTFLVEVGDPVGGERELRGALALDSTFVPAYVNLADVYRGLGRDSEGERLLRAGLTRLPRSALLQYSLGLALTRLQRGDNALDAFERAEALDPANARFAYVHAVALHSAGKVDEAIRKLQSTLKSHPDDGDVLNALASYLRDRGDHALARRYTERLRRLAGGRR